MKIKVSLEPSVNMAAATPITVVFKYAELEKEDGFFVIREYEYNKGNRHQKKKTLIPMRRVQYLEQTFDSEELDS